MKGKVNKPFYRTCQKCERLLDMKYKLSELANELDVSEKYVRKSLVYTRGMPCHYDNTGHIWFYGNEVKQWLANAYEAKYKKSVTPLKENEFYCVNCHTQQEIDNYTIETNSRGTPYKKAYCPVCGTRMNKFIRGS